MSSLRTNLGYVDFFVNENGQKIARKYSREGPNPGVDRPDREFPLLQLFENTGLFPRPVRQYHHNGHLVVEMECCGHDLQQHLEHMTPTNKFSPGVARGYFWQLLHAVKVMHSHGYAHCDIKPENVLLNPVTNRIVLCDLGQATKVHQGRYAHGPRGTNGYRAPEVLQPYDYDAFAAGKPYDYDAFAADMFSLGQVLFTMLYGANLYDFQANTIPPFWFRKFGYAGGDRMRNYLADPAFQLESDAVDLLAGLFAPAKNRLNLEQVLDHDWMRTTT